MRFQVPQFIEVEDKIFGPLTLKQFIYLAGGAGLCIVAFLFLPRVFAVIASIGALGFSFLLAFYKYNNRPFVVFLESLFNYSMHPKLYIWRKQDQLPVRKEVEKEPTASATAGYIPKLSNSKLKDLTWTLDTRRTPNSGEK
jgi:hypothetical protein